MLVLALGVGQSARCYAQTQAGAQAKVAVLREPLPSDNGTTTSAAAARPAARPEPEVSLDIAKELAVMKARIEQLETELKSRNIAETAPGPATAPARSGRSR